MSDSTATITSSQPVFAEGLKEVLGWNWFQPSNVEIIIDKSSTRTIIESSVGTLVIIDDPRLMFRTFCDNKLGAGAIVLSSSRHTAIEDGLTSLANGQYFIDPAFKREEEITDLSLTDRQAEILQFYADGFTTDAIAEQLCLSVETIRTHTKRILAKLNAKTRTHAVAIAVNESLIHVAKP